jgi:hypothetical protein
MMFPSCISALVPSLAHVHLREFGGRYREALPEAWQVLELEVDGLDVVALDEVADLLGGLWGQVSVPPMRA